MKPLIPLILLGMLVGCAARQRTKTDNSAASGFTRIDDGAKAIDDGAFKVRNGGPLTPEQQSGMTLIETGRKNVGAGAIIASKAYDASTKLNDPANRAQHDRINWCEIIGGVAFAIGMGLIFGGSTTALKGLGAILAISGGSFSAYLLVLDAVSPAMKFVAMGMGVVIVAAFAWFVFEKMREKKNLAVEQKATQEIATTTPAGILSEIKNNVSDQTAALLANAATVPVADKIDAG